jgi:hypothetical protein
MADLRSIDLPTVLKKHEEVLQVIRRFLNQLERAKEFNHQREFRHITNYMIGQLEKCGPAAVGLNMDWLASATRNLFELSFVVDYVCSSDQNMRRFMGDCAIDDLEVMERFRAVDQRAADYVPDEKATERAERLKRIIADLGLTGEKPLMAIDFARAVGREDEYKTWYKVYSKLTHASAWAVLGGSEHPLSWDAMALLLLLQANGHAAVSLSRLYERLRSVIE